MYCFPRLKNCVLLMIILQEMDQYSWTGHFESGCETAISQSQQFSMDVNCPLDLSMDSDHHSYCNQRNVNEEFQAITPTCSAESGDHQLMLSDVLQQNRTYMEALHSLANEVCCSIAVHDQPQASTSHAHPRSLQVEKPQHGFNYNIDNPYLQGATFPFHQVDQALHPQMVNQLTPPFSEPQSFQLLYPLIPVSPRSQESQLDISNNNVEMIDLQPMLDPEEAKRSRLETLERFHEMVDAQGSAFGHPIVDNSPLTEDDTDVSTGERSSSQLCCDSTPPIENPNLNTESQSNRKVETVCLLSSSSAQSDNQAEEEVVIRITLPSTPATPLRPTIPPTPLTPIRSPMDLHMSTPLRSYQPRKSSKPKKIVADVVEELPISSSSSTETTQIESMEIQSSSSSVDELPIGRSPCKSAPKIPPYEIPDTDSIGPHCSAIGLSRIHIEKGGFHGGVRLPCSQLINGVAIELTKFIRQSKRFQRKDLLRLLPRLFDIEPLDFENNHLVKRFYERLITPILLSPIEPPRTRSSSGSLELPYAKRNSTAAGLKTDNAALRRAEFEAKQFVVPADLNMNPTKPYQNPRLIEIKQLDATDATLHEEKSCTSKPQVKSEPIETTSPELKPRNGAIPRVTKPSVRKPTLTAQVSTLTALLSEIREEQNSQREKTDRRMELLERRLELSERSKADLVRFVARSRHQMGIFKMQLASRSKKQFTRRRSNIVQNCKSHFFYHFNF